MGGVTIQRASLHNLEIFETFDLHKNDTLLIERANDVIPQVLKNLDVNKEDRGEKFLPPTHCSECGSGLIRKRIGDEDIEICGIKTVISRVNGVENLICDSFTCKGKEFGNLIKWANVVFKDSKGLGGNTIKTFHEIGLIKTPADFYKLKAEQISSLPRFGDRKTEIILGVINENKEIVLENFIGGLNIPNFGRRMAKNIIDAGIDTLQKMRDVSIEELCSINGVERKTAKTFKTNIERLELSINELFDVGITIVKNDEPEAFIEATDGLLNGKSFCFTGAIQKEENGKRLTRKDMQNLVIKNGGIVFDSVKPGLTYLVQADPNKTSSKTKKANELGTKILSEEQFFEMIGD